MSQTLGTHSTMELDVHLEEPKKAVWTIDIVNCITIEPEGFHLAYKVRSESADIMHQLPHFFQSHWRWLKERP